MILKTIRHRLGFAIVIAVAAVGTALVTGSSVLAAVVAIAVVVVLGALLAGRHDRSRDANEPRQKRAPGEPFAVSYRWRGRQLPDLADLSESLTRRGVGLSIDSQSTREAELSGGSQLWTRLFGGYFVDPKRLPVRVELKAIGAEGNGGTALELNVRDRLGVAVRDGALEDRYMDAAAAIRGVVETRLTAMGSFEAEDDLGRSDSSERP